tara:strand:+ start:794 stop:1093 length:300 start_codon:yes stop_codon:yes gene_type:complete
MRKNYFVGGLVQAAITLGTKALGKKTTSSRSTSFVDPRMARAELLQTLDESAQQSIASLKEGQEMRNRQNPVENLIARLLTSFEDEGGDRKDLDKYWNA